MDKWGLGYEDIKKFKPDTIMLRTSNQGQDGPFSRLGGLGLQLNALGGFAHFTGWTDRDPLSLMFAYSDYFSPHFAVALLAAALDYRRRTGKGQMIDLSQSEVSSSSSLPTCWNIRLTGRNPAGPAINIPMRCPIMPIRAVVCT